jgi:hypothetical protein
MNRYRWESIVRRPLGVTASCIMVAAAAGCSFSSGPDNKPSTAEIRIEGTSPNTLKLITSTDFYEQLNTGTGEYTPILVTSDTLEIELPYNATMGMGPLSSIYVELLQPEVATASVRMRVDLDNGEGYDQSATLADQAALIYYFIFTEYVL